MQAWAGHSTNWLTEAAAAPIDGWDFSWLDGRATEERPSWGYQRLMSQRLATASAGLDIDTGGGEVLAGAAAFPPTMVATESWPPNAALATKLLHPRGVVVVATRDEPRLPFADEAFDLVTSRHATVVRWAEIARVLRPGGSYLAQQIGPATMRELFEYFLGPQPAKWAELQPDTQAAQARPPGLQVVQMRMERLRAEFFDIGAVDLLPAQGDLDRPGLQRRALSRAAARDARADRGRRPVRRACDTTAGRGPQTLSYPSARSTSSACCRSAG